MAESKQTRWSRERVAKGLCARCGEKRRDFGSLCNRHHFEQVERMKKRRRAGLARRDGQSYEPGYAILSNGCWEPTGDFVKNKLGYCSFPLAHGWRLCHRYFYEQHYGTLQPGLTLDHVCRNRSCCNPAHLEPLTQAENCQRKVNAAINAADVALARWLKHQGLMFSKVARMLRKPYPAINHSVNGRSWRNVSKVNFQAFRTRVFPTASDSGYYRTLEPLSTIDLPSEVTSE